LNVQQDILSDGEWRHSRSGKGFIKLLNRNYYTYSSPPPFITEY
jgi:hypothetical protein